MRAMAVVGTFAALALLLVACSGGGDDSTGPDPNGGTAVDTVRLVGTAFQPATLNVERGRTVVWVNTQPIVHTVTPDGHSQWTRATTSSPGEVLRVTFNTAGSFDYLCEPHVSEGMTGTITVQ